MPSLDICFCGNTRYCDRADKCFRNPFLHSLDTRFITMTLFECDKDRDYFMEVDKDV